MNVLTIPYVIMICCLTKYYKLDGLNSIRQLFLTAMDPGKYKIKMLSGSPPALLTRIYYFHDLI